MYEAFIFFRRVRFLFGRGLIGNKSISGTVIVIRRPIASRRISEVDELFGIPTLGIHRSKCLDGLVLHFPGRYSERGVLSLVKSLELYKNFLGTGIATRGINRKVGAGTTGLIERRLVG